MDVLRLPALPRTRKQFAAYRAYLNALKHLHRLAGGIRHIPRQLRLGWS